MWAERRGDDYDTLVDSGIRPSNLKFGAMNAGVVVPFQPNEQKHSCLIVELGMPCLHRTVYFSVAVYYRRPSSELPLNF
jgi:hypothetical protein